VKDPVAGRPAVQHAREALAQGTPGPDGALCSFKLGLAGREFSIRAVADSAPGRTDNSRRLSACRRVDRKCRHARCISFP
jgi:hypothetical protein